MACIDWLFTRFEESRARPYMIWRDQVRSYDWLLDRVGAWRARLDREAVLTGSVVGVVGDYTPGVVALLLALVERGAVVVPLTVTDTTQREALLDLARAEVVVAFLEGEEGVVVRRGVQAAHPLIRSLVESGDPGLILFSSGSTGTRKAALHNFARLLEKFKQRRHVFVTITFLLLDHIGGLNTLFYVLSNTGTLVALEDRAPDRVCAAIQRHQAELLPTSPTFLNLLLISEAYKRYDLSSLKRITYGTEVMPPATLERVCRFLPGVELQQTYGLSEIGILRSKSLDAGSLWVKLGGEGFETRVKDGTLWVRAASAMLGYLNAPSPFDDGGWLDTGDVVEANGDYLRILGRRSEIINVGGEKVPPAAVESVLAELPNVRDAVVFGEPNPITGQIVAARFNLVEPEDPVQFRRRVREVCRDRLPTSHVPARIIITNEPLYSERFKKVRPGPTDR